MWAYFTWEDGWMVYAIDELRASFLEAIQEASVLLQSQMEIEPLEIKVGTQSP
jgi:hypothetical protein